MSYEDKKTEKKYVNQKKFLTLYDAHDENVNFFLSLLKTETKCRQTLLFYAFLSADTLFGYIQTVFNGGFI